MKKQGKVTKQDQTREDNFLYDHQAQIVTEKSGGKQSKIEEMFELLDTDALMRTAKVMAEGAKRYKKENWRKLTDVENHVGRAIRHLYLYLKARRLKQVGGEDELAHAMCRVMFAMGVEKHG